MNQAKISSDELSVEAATLWLEAEVTHQIKLIRKSKTCVFCGGKKPVKRLVCKPCSVRINTRFPNPYN